MSLTTPWTDMGYSPRDDKLYRAVHYISDAEGRYYRGGEINLFEEAFDDLRHKIGPELVKQIEAKPHGLWVQVKRAQEKRDPFGGYTSYDNYRSGQGVTECRYDVTIKAVRERPLVVHYDPACELPCWRNIGWQIRYLMRKPWRMLAYRCRYHYWPAVKGRFSHAD